MFAYLSDLFDEPIAAQPEVKSIEDIIEALISEAPGTEEKPAEEITTEEVPTAQSTESFIPTTPPPMATTEITSPPVQTQAQPLDLMQVPDFLGGYLPTPTGYYKYLEEKMKEDQRKQIDLKCQYCQRITGNKGSHTRHIKACRERPEKIAERVRQATCDKCGKVLKTRQAKLGHERHCKIV